MASPETMPPSQNRPTDTQKVLGDILSTLNSDLDRRELFKQVALTIQPLIPFDRFSLSLEQLRFWFYLEDGEVTTERDRGLYNEHSSASTWVFIHKKPLLRTDILNDPQFEYDPDLTEELMRSDLILPLFIDDQIIGTFNFTSRLPNVYNQPHVDSALALTDAIAAVIKI